MYLVLFFYIAAFFSLSLGEFGQFPFGSSFSFSITDILLSFNFATLLIWNIGIKKNLKVPSDLIYLIIFWSFLILSLFFSLNLSGWLYLVRFIVYSSTFYITYSLVKSGILNLQEILSLLKITTVALAVIGLLQLLFFPDLESLTSLGYDPHKNRIFSTFLDPNFLGTFLNFSLILLVFELVNSPSENLGKFLKQHKWDLITSVLLAVTIILTYSRSAYLMMAISLGIVLMVKNLKLLGVLAIITLVMFLTFPPFSQRITGALNIDKSAAERFLSWDKGIKIFQNNPILGVGFNNIRDYSIDNKLLRTYSANGGNAGAGIDSSIIFVLATSGILGFLAFIYFLIKVISNIISSLLANFESLYTLKLKPVRFLNQVHKLPGLSKWYKSMGPSNFKYLSFSLPFFALTVGLFAGSFFINSLFYPPIMFIWFSFLGVFYALSES